jgi:hypothetical protein
MFDVSIMQAEALLMYVMKVGPALQEVAEHLPDFEAEDAIVVASGVGELAKVMCAQRLLVCVCV